MSEEKNYFEVESIKVSDQLSTRVMSKRNICFSREEKHWYSPPTITLILVSSDIPIAGDLAASGAFQPGDVTFIPGAGCHLSFHGCTLLIKVATNSHDYTKVPVVVSDKAATYSATFNLSVIEHGETAKTNSNLAKIILIKSQQLPQTVSKVVAVSTAQVAILPPPTMILTSGNLSATIIPHTSSTTFYKL